MTDLDLGRLFADTVHRPSPASLGALGALLAGGVAPRLGGENLLVRAVMAKAAPAVLRVILSHGVSAGCERTDGAPVIVLAARRGDHAAVDVLLGAGADVDARDSGGRTALMHAVERDAVQVVSVLLLAGADPEVASDDGMTARMLAHGWQAQRMQSRMGGTHLTLGDVPIVRTAVRLLPTECRLNGDPWVFALLADVITAVVDDLGDNGWEARTGFEAHEARVFVARLRREVVKAPDASWHRLDVTAEEWGIARRALAETALVDAAGAGDFRLSDLLAELERF